MYDCLVQHAPLAYKFTGKERDAESGLDNFGARYNSSQYARFMTPDPMGGKLADPQTLNKYPYVRNNPLTLTDPTGLYTIGCNNGVTDCQKQEKNFDKALQKALKSKDASVRNAAAAYGPLSKQAGDAGDNGVNVTLMTKVDAANDNGVTRNQAGTPGWTYDDVSNTFKPATQVDIKSGLSGNTLEETAVHEGVHVEDRNNFVGSFGAVLGPVGYSVHSDNALNILGRQSEVNAFTVQNVLRQSLGEPPIDIQRTLSRPPYSTNPSMDRPIILTVPQ